LALCLDDSNLVLQAIERCLALEPRFAMGHTMLAMYQKSYDAAERELKIALELEPREPVAHFRYACLLTEKNFLDKAEYHFRFALDSRPQYTQAKSAYALLLIKCQRFNDAEILLKNMGTRGRKVNDSKIMIDNSASCHNAYALLLKQQNKYDAAEYHYRQAIRLRPKRYPEALNNLGLLLIEKKSYDQAEDFFRQAIECSIHENYPDPHNNLGFLFFIYKNDIVNAQIYFKNAIKIDPQYAPARNNYATTLTDINQAQMQLEIALDIDPNYADAHNSLALILHLVRSDLTRAEHHYLRALSLNPNHSEAHNNYALFLLGAVGEGGRQEADSIPKATVELHFKLALQANPNNANAAHNFAYFILASSCTPAPAAAATNDEYTFQEDQAMKLLLTALKINPNHAPAHETYALLEQRRGHIDIAAKHYLASIDANPNRVSSHCRYAQLLIRKNDFDTAKFHLEKALELRPDNAPRTLFLLAHIYENREAYNYSLELINSALVQLLSRTNNNIKNSKDDNITTQKDVSQTSERNDALSFTSSEKVSSSTAALNSITPQSSILALRNHIASDKSFALLPLDWHSTDMSFVYEWPTHDFLVAIRKQKVYLEALVHAGD